MFSNDTKQSKAQSLIFLSILCDGQLMDLNVVFDFWLASTFRSALTTASIEKVNEYAY